MADCDKEGEAPNAGCEIAVWSSFRQQRHITFLCLPPFSLPDERTLPAPSLPSPTCSWCRICSGQDHTEGHGSPTCFDTTPKEGVIYICSVGLLFSSNHGEKKKQKTFLPALVCSPPLSHLSSLCSLSSAGLILQIIPGGGRGIISVER